MQNTFLRKQFGLPCLIFLSVFLWMTLGLTLALQAADRRPDRPGPRPHIERRVDRPRDFNDFRYHHNRKYPVRGQYVKILPRDRHVFVHRNSKFYFSGGIWYRPDGARFVIAAPPIGLVVPFLPSYYATIWVGGIPYYYANEVYYANRGNGYVVVEPPRQEVVSEIPPPADQMFIYPRLGQSEQQQADDRYACHRWAVEQTGFDPTQPQGDTQERLRIEKRADYQRAMSACLDGRGYTVK